MPYASIVMCNHNGAAYLRDAVLSALLQEKAVIEVIVVDDASQDESCLILRALAARDPRLRVIECERNLGPAAARNLALAVARGDWIAILDSDDLMHPERIARLIAFAEAEGVDLVADDLIAFDAAHLQPPRQVLSGQKTRGVVEVTLGDYIDSNCLYRRRAALGYLKPLFRRSLLADERLRYNESLRNAEDFDFILRLMASGRRYLILPEALYFYRRHAHSLSHRLSREKLAAMIAADETFRRDFPTLSKHVARALQRRLRNLRQAQGYEEIVTALKARRPLPALRAFWQVPGAALLLHLPLLARLGGLLPRKPPPAKAEGRHITFLSRQRITGATNGSSAYVLSLAAELRRQGFHLHYICPSPAVFGSRPVLTLGREMGIFESYHIRGGVRIGRRIILTEPYQVLRALGRAVELAALRLGLLRRDVLGPAAYAIAAPLGDKDRLFLAAKAPHFADLVICDYAFMTEALPFTLRPEAPSAVLMHDLFSARSAQFAKINGADSVAKLDFATEMRLLGRADRILAIQRDEAAIVGAALGAGRVILAPMAMAGVDAPQKGDRGHILFVGSNTAPNVDAMHWFLAEVWPLIRRARPETRFDIVGGVCRDLHPAPEGVSLHGQVGDLAPFYRQAGVVVSPLRAGSGLKIKLVEALSQGKAMVVTAVTCQGVEDLLQDAVVVADEAAAMAEEILTLLGDDECRTALAAQALKVSKTAFGAEGCYLDAVEFLQIRGAEVVEERLRRRLTKQPKDRDASGQRRVPHS